MLTAPMLKDTGKKTAQGLRSTVCGKCIDSTGVRYVKIAVGQQAC